jgi:uncharacterized membrane protein YjdF
MRWWSVLPVVSLVLLDATGDYLHFYSTWQYYDTVLHFLGSSGAALLIYMIYFNYYPFLQQHYRLLALLTITTTICVGVLYELEEYLEDVFTGSHRLGDGFDTANDLLMNSWGAIIALALLSTYQHHAKKTQLGSSGKAGLITGNLA